MHPPARPDQLIRTCFQSATIIDQSLIAPRSIDRTRLLTCPTPTHLRRFDITQTANANWREAEYTKQRARSAESELASANETIRTLEAKLMTTESRLAHEKRGVAAELQRARRRR